MDLCRGSGKVVLLRTAGAYNPEARLRRLASGSHAPAVPRAAGTGLPCIACTWTELLRAADAEDYQRGYENALEENTNK